MGRKMHKILIAALAALVVLLGTATVGDALAYRQKTTALQQQWKEEEAAGVPRARIDGLRHQLTQIEAQHGGSTAYSVVSFALVRDPFVDLENQTHALYNQVTRESRAQAQAALQRVKQEYGPTSFDADQRARQLADARQPAHYQRLARSWNQEADQLVKVKADLGTKAGGMNNGLPADVISLRDQVEQGADQLRKAQLWTDPADQALGTVKQYLGSNYQAMLTQHDDVKGQIQAANDKVAQRLDLHSSGVRLAGSLPGLLQYGSGGDYAGRADQARQSLSAAKDDGQLKTAVETLQGLVNDLWQKKQEAQRRLAAGTGGCESNIGGKLILVSLSAQKLTACDGNTTYLSTLVTTGRPGLETPTMTSSILGKWRKYYMVSTCAKDNPTCYYDPAWVEYAMQFRGDGYFFHSWPQPKYGPGTQYASYASHGCIHTPIDQLETLYEWATVGTAVMVTP